VKCVFVTSSGTEIGKTFVATLLIRQARARGARVAALKPVISGYGPETAAESDTALLLAALGEPVDAAGIERISPWRFAAPLSPDIAARREGRAIDFDALLDFCRRARAADGDCLIIEGVGGAMVPLTGDKTVLDWIAALDAPAIVVVGSYLGTISHTLTTVAAMRAKDVPVRAVVVCESTTSPVPLDETCATLARFIAGAPVVALPRLEDAAEAPDLFRLLEPKP